MRASGDLTGGILGADGKSGAKSAKTRRRHGWHLRRPPRRRDGTGDSSSRSASGTAVPGKGAARYRTIPGETIYGALDLGTNNCRLLLARPGETGFEVVDAFSRIVRLGEGVSQTGEITQGAIERTPS